MTNKNPPTPQELNKVAEEYLSAINRLQMLGLIVILDDKGNCISTPLGDKVAEALLKFKENE